MTRFTGLGFLRGSEGTDKHLGDSQKAMCGLHRNGWTTGHSNQNLEKDRRFEQ